MASIERLVMAEGTAGPETPTAPQTGAARPEGQAPSQPIPRDQVLANASLAEKERLQAAQGLLGSQLKPEQEKALLEAHKVGLGEPGKGDRPAGVGNYTQQQLGKKLDILEKSGFSKEQRFSLVKSGLVGVLPPAEFNNFDPNDYAADPALKKIADQVHKTGLGSHADEHFLNRIAARVEGLSDNPQLSINPTLSDQLLDELERLRIIAEQTSNVAQRPARPQRPPSMFEQFQGHLFDARTRLKTAENMPQNTPQEIAARQAAMQVEETAVNAETARIESLFKEIDELKGPTGEKLELLSVARNPLIAIYHDARVAVGQKEKLGVGEYRGQGTLERLAVLQQIIDPNAMIQDLTGRIGQIVQDSGIFLGEEQKEFWSNPKIAAIENMPEVAAFKLRWGMNSLKEGIEGSIDYFNRAGLKMVTDVVKDRKAAVGDYGLYNSWDTVIRDKIGRPVKDEEGKPVSAKNFDDVRMAIEDARRQDPWISNRGDYETWIQFVADDVEELREMRPYIIAKVMRKLGTGEEQPAYQTLTQEKEKIDKAVAAFPIESERQFRRIKSEFTGDFNLEGQYIFSDRFRKDPSGFFHFQEFIASSCQDTEFQDHFADSVLLDREGLMLVALEELAKEDGIFWRYNQKSADTNNKANKVGDFYRWQKNRRKEIVDTLLKKKLKPMQTLLTTHPAFQRLKAKFDIEDQEDKAAHQGHITDADGKQTTITRWTEYCEKALLWEQTGEFGDPREAERVTFQHPLARSFKAPTKNALGQIQDELYDMFEDDPRTGVDKGYTTSKTRRAKSILDKAEKVSRAFLVDSTSALAWFTPRVVDEKTGGIDIVKTKALLDEMNKYLTAAGMASITDSETVPYKTLHRIMMQSLLREDQNKPSDKKRFKMYYMLRKMGFDLDMPTYAGWHLGAHDTGRPAFMLDVVYKDPGLAQALKEAIKTGLDEKNTGAKWAEDERRMHLLMQLVIRQKFPKYFNYPGHDTRGAGVKDIRNILDPIYGISARTSWISDLTPYLQLGEQDPAKDYGCSRSPLRQWLGLVKGGDEVIFKKTGYTGIPESPRDMESWVKRFNTVVEQYNNMTKGPKEGGPGILKSAPFSGMYLWRDFTFSNLNEKYTQQRKSDFPLNQATEAIVDMKEATYKAGIDLAGRTAAPLIAFMKHTVESTFGRNPDSAKFLNTLLWYAVSKWMDTSWEYRTKPGYAVDGNLHLARYFIHTMLQEDEGLIYSDEEWDQVMLGYIKKADGTKVIRYEVKIANGQEEAKDQDGNWIPGEVEEGLIDSFPEELRKEILNGESKDIKDSTGKVVHRIRDYWLPFGIKSKYPETFANYYRDSVYAKRDYKEALNQITPRRTIKRP